MKCDAKGFAAMYSTVYMDMYRFALCMMKSSHDAEDAVSVQKLDLYDPGQYMQNKMAAAGKGAEKGRAVFLYRGRRGRPGMGEGGGREKCLCHPD